MFSRIVKTIKEKMGVVEKRDAHWFVAKASKEEKKKIMDEMAQASGEEQKEVIRQYRKSRSY